MTNGCKVYCSRKQLEPLMTLVHKPDRLWVRHSYQPRHAAPLIIMPKKTQLQRTEIKRTTGQHIKHTQTCLQYVRQTSMAKSTYLLSMYVLDIKYTCPFFISFPVDLIATEWKGRWHVWQFHKQHYKYKGIDSKHK